MLVNGVEFLDVQYGFSDTLGGAESAGSGGAFKVGGAVGRHEHRDSQDERVPYGRLYWSVMHNTYLLYYLEEKCSARGNTCNLL